MLDEFVMTGKQIPKHLNHMFRLEKDIKKFDEHREETKQKAHMIGLKTHSESALFIQ